MLKYFCLHFEQFIYYFMIWNLFVFNSENMVVPFFVQVFFFSFFLSPFSLIHWANVYPSAWFFSPFCLLSLCLSLSDVCNSTDLPEVEIISLLEEQLPHYKLRADTIYGYDHDDWLHTPLISPDVNLDLTTEQIEETLKYFRKHRITHSLLFLFFSQTCTDTHTLKHCMTTIHICFNIAFT